MLCNEYSMYRGCLIRYVSIVNKETLLYTYITGKKTSASLSRLKKTSTWEMKPADVSQEYFYQKLLTSDCDQATADERRRCFFIYFETCCIIVSAWTVWVVSNSYKFFSHHLRSVQQVIKLQTISIFRCTRVPIYYTGANAFSLLL